MIRQFSQARKKFLYGAQKALGLPDANGRLVSLGEIGSVRFIASVGVINWFVNTSLD
ncbi:MAG: hypothetical protein IPK01_11455 [Acidobacteria bacterium]|nr:hypothetical protein [Acidobacteriota bacterium]